MTMIKFKKCTSEDLKELQDISILTFTDTFKDQNTEENLQAYLQQAYSDDQLMSELNNINSAFYFLKNNDETVGYIKLNIKDAQSEGILPTALELERIYITPTHKRQGYGRQLIAYAEKRAKELVCTDIWLGVWEFNTDALAFYERMGYEKIGEHSFFMGEDEQTDDIMKKVIEN